MHDYTLWLASDTCVAVGHGEGDHFVGACYDAREMALLFSLAFGDGFYYGRVIGSEIDEAVCDAQFPECFEESITRGVPERLSVNGTGIL